MGNNYTKISGHKGDVIFLYQMKNGNILSGSRDTTIKIWKEQKDSLVLLKTLEGHKEGVSFIFETEDNRIISVDYDHNLILWNPSDDYKIMATHRYKDEICQMIQLTDSSILFATVYGEFVIFNLNDLSPKEVIKAHDSFINDLKYIRKNILVSASSDNYVKIWNVETKITEIATLKTHEFPLKSIYIIDENSFYTIGDRDVLEEFSLKLDDEVELKNTKSFSFERGNGCKKNLFKFKDSILGFTQHNKVVLLDHLQNMKIIQTLTYSYLVSDILLLDSGNLLVSYYENKNMLLWDGKKIKL